MPQNAENSFRAAVGQVSPGMLRFPRDGIEIGRNQSLATQREIALKFITPRRVIKYSFMKFSASSRCCCSLCRCRFPAQTPPRIFFSDLESGPNIGGQKNQGVWVTIWGKGFGAERGASTVTIGGGAAAEYPIWTDTKITFQLGPAAKTGDIVVSVRAKGERTRSDGHAGNAEQRPAFHCPPGKDLFCRGEWQ